MVTTNINVSDGLMNGAMGSVAQVVIDKRTGDITTILVVFDNEIAGQEAKCTSLYKHINENAVPVQETQTTFPVHGKTYFRQQGHSSL